MVRAKLLQTFAKIQKELGLDYAILEVDEFGDCNTCVLEGLTEKFGVESRGIHAKHWLYGGNAKDKTILTQKQSLHIAHDVTPEDGERIVTLFKENGYFLESDVYSKTKTFHISEKPFVA
jgi:hypothetical protein